MKFCKIRLLSRNNLSHPYALSSDEEEDESSPRRSSILVTPGPSPRKEKRISFVDKVFRVVTPEILKVLNVPKSKYASLGIQEMIEDAGSISTYLKPKQL